MINSGTRQSIPTRIVSVIVSPTIDDAYSSTVELNSHAETCMLGANSRVIAYTEEECNNPLSSRLPPINGIPIVQAATAYIDPETGETVILIKKNSDDYFKCMKHTGLRPVTHHTTLSHRIG